MAAGEEGEDLKVTCDRNERTGRIEALTPGTVSSLRDCLDDSIFKQEKRSGEKVLGWVCAVEAPVGHSEGSEAAAEESRGGPGSRGDPQEGQSSSPAGGERLCAHVQRSGLGYATRNSKVF